MIRAVSVFENGNRSFIFFTVNKQPLALSEKWRNSAIPRTRKRVLAKDPLH